MKDVGQLKPLSAFEWASVSQYIVYISGVADLEEFSSNDLISFPLAKIGYRKLADRKERVLVRLRANMKKVGKFVEHHKEELADSELSVIRSMYIQYKHSAEVVEEHLRIARLYQEQEVSDSGLFSVPEEVQDDLPF